METCFLQPRTARCGRHETYLKVMCEMKTDLEISKKLALAIGYRPEHVRVSLAGTIHVFRPRGEAHLVGNPALKSAILWGTFDYRWWDVIGPIAERYNLFPERFCRHWTVRGRSNTLAETPQKAIALAVIQGVRK